MTCDVCGKQLGSFLGEEQATLKLHKNKIHYEVDETPCPECGKVFETKLKMQCHLRAVHDLSNEDWECPECSKSFTFRRVTATQQKKLHLKTHQAKEVHCELCNKSFRKKM